MHHIQRLVAVEVVGDDLCAYSVLNDVFVNAGGVESTLQKHRQGSYTASHCHSTHYPPGTSCRDEQRLHVQCVNLSQQAKVVSRCLPA